MDEKKHIAFWLTGADEDWSAAEALLNAGKRRHALFFAHLALEKVLKAYFVKSKSEAAPRIHNLSRLAELANLELSDAIARTLAAMNDFQMEGRYPGMPAPPPDPADIQRYFSESKEALEWLKKKF